jgi:hypothetical protein
MIKIIVFALSLLTPALLLMSIALYPLLVKQDLADVTLPLDVSLQTSLIILLPFVMMAIFVPLAMLVLMAIAFQVKMLFVMILFVRLGLTVISPLGIARILV